MNLFVKSRVRYIEIIDLTNLRENDQNVHYIEGFIAAFEMQGLKNFHRC